MSKPPLQLEIRRLVETDEGFKVVSRGLCEVPRAPESQTEDIKTPSSNPFFKSTIVYPCFPKKGTIQSGSVNSRSRLKNALLCELEEKLKPQKTKVDQQIEERHLRRQQTVSEPTQIDVITPPPLASGTSVDSSASIMDELKQRLNKICVSSNFEVDRIVKESKTTTITESRETIHFRPPEEESSVRPSLPPVPSKRLSIRAPTDLETRQDPPHIYVNISELNEHKQKPKEVSPKMSETKETPIMSATTPQDAADKQSFKKSPTTSSAAQPPQSLPSVPPLPGTVKKTTGCAFNILKSP